MNQNDIEGLTVFAEQNYCKGCNTNPCQTFTAGKYEDCVPLLAAFNKQESDYHTFLESVQKQHIPGKCVFCREEEVDDKDKDYTLVTLRYTDGKIRMRGYLCSHHYKQEWVD